MVPYASAHAHAYGGVLINRCAALASSLSLSLSPTLIASMPTNTLEYVCTEVGHAVLMSRVTAPAITIMGGGGCNDIAGDNRNSHAQNQKTGWCMRSAVQCDVRCRGVPPPMPYTSVDTGSARLSWTRSQRFRIMPLEHAHVRMRAPACHAIAVSHPEETTPTAQCKAKVWGRRAKQTASSTGHASKGFFVLASLHEHVHRAPRSTGAQVKV